MSIARKVKRSGTKIAPRPEMVFIPGGEFTMGSGFSRAEAEARAAEEFPKLPAFLDRRNVS